MSLLWMDSFDHYGTGSTGRTNMLAGQWAEVYSGLGPSTSFFRTGTHSFYAYAGGKAVVARRVFGAPKTTAGVGYALYITSLPVGNASHGLGTFCDFANSPQVLFVLQSTGAVSAYRGTTATLLGTSADGVIVAEAWQHVEMAVTISDTVGAAEVRVNGVTVLSLSGIDTAATSLIETSQWRYEGLSVSYNMAVSYLDDMFAWDSEGSSNNTFIGDRRVRTLYPTADTATAEWTPSGAASGYAAIDDVTPDGDTTYVTAGVTVPTTSEYEIDDLPASVVSINAVQTVPMSKKADAGDGNLQVSLVSGASVDDGADRPLTTAYTYWHDVSETDPATSAPWTPTAFNAAKLRIRRTA